jgi:hypothetical protein
MTDSSEMGGFAMTAMMLICAGLLGFSRSDRSEYQEAAAKAGRDAAAHLKLAKRCEANGMDAERLFVGAHQELVHDNSLPPPVLTPFDAEPSLASTAE